MRRQDDRLSASVNLLDCEEWPSVPSSVGPRQSSRERPMGTRRRERARLLGLHGGLKARVPTPVPTRTYGVRRARAHTHAPHLRKVKMISSVSSAAPYANYETTRKTRSRRDGVASRVIRDARFKGQLERGATRAHGELICEILRFINICSAYAVNIRNSRRMCGAYGRYRNDRPRSRKSTRAIFLSFAFPLIPARFFGVTSRTR